tara:strand:+ start:196 stop:873 length:678 start_codon:yes stop_codon:yes gene_type:complete
MAIHISNTSKMPTGCGSWSLQAIDTCPGSYKKITPELVDTLKRELVDACKGCYARFGNYNYPNVKKPRASNREDWKRSGWADDMVSAMEKSELFRWFDSGDCYSVALATKILEVIQRTPHVQHWFPTRMHKFAKFREVLATINRQKNAVVRRSSDSITGEIDGRWSNGSTIIPTVDHAKPGQTVCHAYSRGGKCGECRQCWDKDVKTIAYPAHGRSMIKLINLAA